MRLLVAVVSRTPHPDAWKIHQLDHRRTQSWQQLGLRTMRLIVGVVVKWLEIQLSRTIHWFGCPTSPSAMQTSNLPRKELTWRSYTVAEALPTTKRVEIIDKKEFAKAALDENVEVFVVHVTSFLTMAIYPARETQIALLVIEEV